jgi:hypothetical protein
VPLLSPDVIDVVVTELPSSPIDLLSSAGTVIAALIAVIALVEGRAARSRVRREARTSVYAWATMSGTEIRESGVKLHVRNNTDTALIGAAARVIPLHLPLSEPESDGTVYGTTSLPVLIVPPMQTATFPLPGRLFRAYGEGWSELAAAITFRDNTGQVWTRQADGVLRRGRSIDEFRKPEHVYEQISKINGKGPLNWWRRRRALRGVPR